MDGRVALITGGARGIGRAIALDLAQDGWSIALCYRTSVEAAAETEGAIRSRGAEALSVQADVSDPGAATSLVKTVLEKWGRIDALVNGAGPYHRVDILQETPAGWRDMLANNLDSVFYVSQAVAPGMIQPGLRLQSLRVLATGEVRFRGIMILPRPAQIVNLSAPDVFLEEVPLPAFGFDPVLGSIRLLNLMTGNRAADELCISQEQVEKEILAKQAQAMRQGALGSRQIWLQVPDWLDRTAIPGWVVRGEIA